ncbi:hypothetical protein EJC51_46815 [Streptomyces aquilus]|uniref:Uncharacterized protein n=1 Tax=Streptomyces aquilus TaxID=2548456 RepID=A0A3Q9C682_9ACTN|nr:hypothetical protein [Streptomyces aquilus]AZP22888.1 hypothetical protein EJC51_46815 [Streptomyces aquilus]
MDQLVINPRQTEELPGAVARRVRCALRSYCDALATRNQSVADSLDEKAAVVLGNERGATSVLRG